MHKVMKTLLGFAVLGAAAGAALAYIKKCKEVNDLGDEEFDDLWEDDILSFNDDTDVPTRTYTTIPSDSSC